MKLIVVGATGLIGTEVIRQALSHKSVTSVVALGRRPTPPPKSIAAGPALEKFQSVTLEDFSHYTDDVKSQLAGADACIWLLAVTPAKSKTMDFELVKKICVDYVMEGFNTLKQLPRANDDKPFRFIYASGAKAERDQTKRPWILGDYTLMRGRIETQLLDGAKESGGIMETCCLRLGLVKSPERMGLVTGMLADAAASMISLPLIDIREISAAAISAAVHGFEKDTLDNDDLIALGRKELKEMGEEPSS